ncbi:MAG: polysaccharide deacetylase family protein [Gemmatimonadaceae bacterium]
MTSTPKEDAPRSSRDVEPRLAPISDDQPSAAPAPSPPLTVIAKRRVLGASSAIGLLAGIRDSRWRQRRLMILCYHSIALDDEHLWSGTYSMSAEKLESRLRMLRDGNYNVLPLDEALRRLYEGTLPPRSVVLTFDDGMHDFRVRALPLLQQFGFPATVYLTTFYSEYAKPIFGLFCSYVLWRARTRMPVVDVDTLLGRSGQWDLTTEQGRARAHGDVLEHVGREKLTLPDRIAFAKRMAEVLGEDYEALLDKRILTVMTPDEAADIARQGIDVQLHTHRHRTPNDRALFTREILENRARIDSIRGGGGTARHFCYPSGEYRPEFLPWLSETGVISATTCDPGLASPKSAPLLLPRLVDTSYLSALDVEGWLAGMSAFFMPRKASAHAQRPRAVSDA